MEPLGVAVQAEAVALCPAGRPAAAGLEAAGAASQADRPAVVGPGAAGAAFPEAPPAGAVPAAEEVACLAWAACRCPDPTSPTPSLDWTADRTLADGFGRSAAGTSGSGVHCNGSGVKVTSTPPTVIVT